MTGSELCLESKELRLLPYLRLLGWMDFFFTLVEALLPGGGGAATASGGEQPPKDERGLKEWIRNKPMPWHLS